MSDIEEYEKYIRKCEMLGTKMFEFVVIDGIVYIVGYIQNNESERLVKIPDFVRRIRSKFSDGWLEGVTQNIKLVGGRNLEEAEFAGYDGNRLDISGLETNNMDDMSYMFSCCINIEKLDLSNFDTSKVKYMSCMFEGCVNLRELDMSNFNTEMVDITSSWDMFRLCEKLRLIITNERTKQWLEEGRKVTHLTDKCRIVVKE